MNKDGSCHIGILESVINNIKNICDLNENLIVITFPLPNLAADAYYLSAPLTTYRWHEARRAKLSLDIHFRGLSLKTGLVIMPAVNLALETDLPATARHHCLGVTAEKLNLKTRASLAIGN